MNVLLYLALELLANVVQASLVVPGRGCGSVTQFKKLKSVPRAQDLDQDGEELPVVAATVFVCM